MPLLAPVTRATVDSAAALSVAEVSGGVHYRHFPNRQARLTAVARNLTRRFEVACPWSGLPGSDPVASAAVYAPFTAENGAGFDLIFAPSCAGAATRA
jgi:hypothetical protein